MNSYDSYRKSIQFGFEFFTKHHRKIIFTEIGTHFVNNVFQKSKIHRIYSYTSIFNKGSIRGLEKIGFQKEGIIRDYYFKNENHFDAILYSIIKEILKVIYSPLQKMDYYSLIL